MSSSVIQTMVEIKSFTLFLLTFVAAAKSVKYEPTWESLDSRPLPQWYDDAKVGIFIHWGVYSVPSIESEWFWLKWKDRNDTNIVDYMEKYYPKGFTYQEFAKDFTAKFFDPVQWADLFVKAGAKYVVLTSKHHEGYTLWPSPYSFSWNSLEVGPHRDLVGELASAIRDTSSLHFGLYHSLLEWYNPLYIADKQKNFSDGNFYYTHKVKPELKEMILRYQPEIVWSDGDWYCTPEYWESKEFLAWLYNESPVKDTVVVNDRWGNDTYGKHGDFYNFADRYNPGVLLKHKWENAMSIDKESWGYRRDAQLSDYLPTTNLIQTLVETISCGGNILINVGPTKDGIIAPIFEERLLQLGKWLQINGEAIYSSRPWQIQNDTVGNVWYTQKDKAVYAITLRWPTNNLLILKSANNLFENGTTKVHFLENGQKLEWFKTKDGIAINFPELQMIQGRFGWTIKIY